MRISKNIDCKNCELKCDIYTASIEIDEDPVKLKPTYAYYSKNEYISKQGTNVSHAIFLINGSAKIFIEGLNNKNIILYLMTPNTYIGLLSFFETPYYLYSVKAMEDTTICMVEIEVLKSLYLKNHDFLLKLNKAFGKSVAQILNKIITLNQKHIRGRIADSLLYLSQIYGSDYFEMKLSRKELGELSGVSEENAVRLLTEFKNDNIIDVKGRKINIKDRHLLTQISNLG
ncbi:MAG: Crp/Fnr family transcriptional regulator [Bacteroidales bacterium]|jgi:CRP/FNR family transcriptional regulator|nr:Crp/Fnr family transcriptional regulator [Bacteroidales bacterium]MCK9498321.1 Crp/Fnr family transcriptional regulator [Bacteroidales bacterium]MDY0314572.1 Crp/Fnr family transcriptional regulator [Bacteroidales bacterium]NLB87411.1 Crp/Fnr family transcriptional regulator [Bacteroidales bacterium]